MERERKVKIFLSIFLVLSILIPSTVYVFLEHLSEKRDVKQEILGITEKGSIPYITNMPPSLVYEMEEYIYIPKLIDADDEAEDLNLLLDDGPEWLSLTAGVLRGMPIEGSAGTYRVVLIVSDGENSSAKEFYILVEARNEG